MQKKSLHKIFLMIIMLSLLIIVGGCGGGGGGGSNGGIQPPLPPQPGSPTLTSLQLSSGSLNPVFSPITTQYTASMEDNVASVTVTATTDSANATISVNGMIVTSGSASGAVDLIVGSTTITIIVKNSAGETTYTVTATRNSQPAYRKITPEEARAMMSQSSNYILLDVRTEAEYREERIAGAMLIPHSEIENRAATELPNKTQLIFVYCQAGVRSEIASRALVGLGYSNVYDIGGILDWPFGTITDLESTWPDVADTSWWNPASSSFTISTPQQLAGVAKLVNGGTTDFSGKTITLANNIDLAGSEWYPIAVVDFQGIFDGASYTISNMELYSSAPGVGLFGFLGANGTIKNVNLTSVDITVGLT